NETPGNGLSQRPAVGPNHLTSPTCVCSGLTDSLPTVPGLPHSTQLKPFDIRRQRSGRILNLSTNINEHPVRCVTILGKRCCSNHVGHAARSHRYAGRRVCFGGTRARGRNPKDPNRCRLLEFKRSNILSTFSAQLENELVMPDVAVNNGLAFGRP
ncbi:hypothetical protein BCR44DRAFT_287779, partial [Catenaria anguillulae PL171]